MDEPELQAIYVRRQRCSHLPYTDDDHLRKRSARAWFIHLFTDCRLLLFTRFTRFKNAAAHQHGL